MKYRDLFFDLDGTLTDSAEGIIHCAVHAFKTLGIAVPGEKELRVMVGPPLRDTFPKLGVPQELVEEAIRLFRAEYETNGMFVNAVFPGIIAMLSRLRAAGYRLYVATSKPEKTAKIILDHFDMTQYFEIVAGASFDLSRDSKADVLRYLLDMTGGCENGVMIGDTDSDVKGAAKLGLPCIGVSWGYGTAESMLKAGAVGIADSIEELEGML